MMILSLLRKIHSFSRKKIRTKAIFQKFKKLPELIKKWWMKKIKMDKQLCKLWIVIFSTILNFHTGKSQLFLSSVRFKCKIKCLKMFIKGNNSASLNLANHYNINSGNQLWNYVNLTMIRLFLVITQKFFREIRRHAETTKNYFAWSVRI